MQASTHQPEFEARRPHLVPYAHGGTEEANEEESLSAKIEAVLGRSFTGGNQVRVLRNGDEIFPAMLKAIGEAEHYIDFLTFVFWTGDIAQRFAEALASRARDGLDVRVLLDGVGAASMDHDLVGLMRDAGAKVYFFREPTGTWRIWRSTHRTHRKILVCDGRVAFTGGVGIAEEWCGDARDANEWRDTHLEIRGPAVAGLQAAFTGNWVEERRDLDALHRSVDRSPQGEARIVSIRSTASVGWSDVATLFWTLMTNARRRLRIATAYFVPDRRSVQLLCDTARRGVDIEILVPGPHTDQRVCQVAHAPDLEELLEAGVKIHRFQPSMMHAKILLIDDELAVVGSPNFNHRSMMQDDETCVAISDRETVDTLSRHFDEDLERTREESLTVIRNRPWYRKVLSWLVRVFRIHM